MSDQNLASNILTSSKYFETYLSQERELTDEELATAYFSLTTDKSPGYDEINGNIIVNTFKNKLQADISSTMFFKILE